MAANILIILLMLLPAIVFWIILKIVRIRLYAYKRAKYPDEYRDSGYQTMGLTFAMDVFRNPHPEDRRYSAMLRNARLVFLITSCIIIVTLYAVYLYLNRRLG